MKVDIDTLTEKSKKIRVEIPKERIEQEFEKVYLDLAKNAVIPGFRKGKIPRSMLKLRLGGDVAMQIGYDLIKETLPDAIKQIEDQIVGMPDIGEWKVEENQPFVYEATVEILPPIELNHYKAVEIPKRTINISEELVTQGLERIREGQSTFEVVNNRPAQKNDRIIGRITLKVDDQPLPGWTNRTLDLDIGKDTFFPGSGMEENMVGACVNQEHIFTVDIPEDYSWYKDIAGKSVAAVLKLNDIKTKVVPEINNELAIDMGLETVDDLKKMVREELETKQNQNIDEEFEQAIFNKLFELNTVPAPEAMVETEAERFIEHYFSYQGNLSEDQKKQLQESVKPMAELNVKKRLVLERIADIENLEVTDDDLNSTFEEMAERENKDSAAIRSEWEEEDAINNLKREIARGKALKWLKDNVVPVDLPEDAPDAGDSEEPSEVDTDAKE